MIPILVDERRLFAGLDRALRLQCLTDVCEFMTPSSVLERLTGVRVIGEAERRAVVRRIVATRGGMGLAPEIRASPSFAARVGAAIDETGERKPFDAIVEQYRTLLAFAGVLDIADALHRALAGERRCVALAALRIDAVLLRGDNDRGFAWRRLCAAAGIALEPIELGPIEQPAIDPTIVAGVATILRYAAGEADVDARRAIICKISGVGVDDARALLTASADRVELLDLIDTGRVGLGPLSRSESAAFARGLRSVTRAYGVPDAGASTVLAALGSAFTLDDDRTVAALVRIARNFDRARTFGPQWEATDLIAEFDAEFVATTAAPAKPFVREPQRELAPDAVRPIPVRQMHFSASSLNAYADCARKWYFRYVCAAVEDRGSSASFYGTAFHAALEDFHLKYSRVGGIDPNELASALDGCIVSAFDRYRGRFDAPVEFELQRRRARRTAKRYLRWLIERAHATPFEVIGCEVVTELELDGHAFVGYIDRLDRDERTGAVTVIDYKTGSIALSAADYRDEVAAFREFQLPFYYWARTAAGERVTKLALIPLKDALLDVAPIELEIVGDDAASDRGHRRDATVGTISIGALQRARVKMIEYAELLASGRLARFPATDDPQACRYCAYRDGCRDRPLVSQERFGR